MRIVITFFLAFVLTSTSAQIIDITPRVTTQGTAIVYASPDEVLLSFSIVSMDDDFEKVRADNRKLSSEVINYLKSMKIADRHIQTQYMRIGDRYRHSRDAKGRFEATQTLNVCIKDVAMYEEIVSGLLSRGVTSVSGPTFRTTELRKHKDEARRKAVIAAREKATLLAKELGQSIGKAIDISEVAYSHGGQNQNAYSNFSQDATTGGESEEVGFAPGQLEIKAIINVSFVLD